MTSAAFLLEIATKYAFSSYGVIVILGLSLFFIFPTQKLKNGHEVKESTTDTSNSKMQNSKNIQHFISKTKPRAQIENQPTGATKRNLSKCSRSTEKLHSKTGAVAVKSGCSLLKPGSHNLKDKTDPTVDDSEAATVAWRVVSRPRRNRRQQLEDRKKSLESQSGLMSVEAAVVDDASLVENVTPQSSAVGTESSAQTAAPKREVSSVKAQPQLPQLPLTPNRRPSDEFDEQGFVFVSPSSASSLLQRPAAGFAASVQVDDLTSEGKRLLLSEVGVWHSGRRLLD